MGLLQAVKEYNPDKGAKLSVCASYWINAHILKYIIDSRSLLKIGTIRGERKPLNGENRNQENASPRLFARNLGAKEREVIEMLLRLACQDLSRDQEVGDESDTTLMDTISDHENIKNTVSDNEEHLVTRMLMDFKGTLNDKEVVVLDRHIMAQEPASLREVGDTPKISHERMRQIERAIANKLSQRVEKQGIAVGQ